MTDSTEAKLREIAERHRIMSNATNPRLQQDILAALREACEQASGWQDREWAKELFRKIMRDHHEDACKPAWWDEVDRFLLTLPDPPADKKEK